MIIESVIYNKVF